MQNSSPLGPGLPGCDIGATGNHRDRTVDSSPRILDRVRHRHRLHRARHDGVAVHPDGQAQRSLLRIQALFAM